MGQHPLGGKASLESIESVPTCNVTEARPDEKLNLRAREAIGGWELLPVSRGTRERTFHGLRKEWDWKPHLLSNSGAARLRQDRPQLQTLPAFPRQVPRFRKLYAES